MGRGEVWLDGGMSVELVFLPALSRPELLAEPVMQALRDLPGADEVDVAEIDPALADTAAFCERYDVSLTESANCVVIVGRRGEVSTYAACVVAATTRADVNGLVRRHLDARKASFAPGRGGDGRLGHGVRRDHAGRAARGLAGAGRRGGGEDAVGGDRLRYPRLQAQAPRTPARRDSLGPGAARPGRSGKPVTAGNLARASRV